MTDSDVFLSFRNVKKTYDRQTLVVRDFNLDVRRGEFVTLLGPSGSGKTTVLMMLAGFEHVSSGDISIDGASITRVAPYERNIGMVFQNYALFPHMTVAENLAYPLRVRKMSKATIRERVDQCLKLVELEGFGDRHPAQLSGGQRQRIALARALIFEPALVLMDEPLSALDKKLREQMQFEISRLHRKLGCTMVYVTHDQAEALTMSDRIAVFNHGVVQQYASPDELYERPANAFVAGFIGENNLIRGSGHAGPDATVSVTLADGTVLKAAQGNFRDGTGPCMLSVRPEKLNISTVDTPAPAGSNVLNARFVAQHYVGDFIRYYFELADGTRIIVKTMNDDRAPTLTEGQSSALHWSVQHSFAFHPQPSAVQGETP
ncbi:MAG TPA: ABC transporter ATP-binding protein [Burkholderiaceae bacterium]|nr:ABC transporter ATP-binding protein [Burkholderiaceae bacterium]